MKCPKCSGVVAAFGTSEGVELDFCSGCSGILFDAGEVSEYFELASDFPDFPKTLEHQKSTEFECPKCDDTWVEVRFEQNESLMLDLCRGCGVIWLDKGEFPRLEALAARLGDPRSKLMRAMVSVEKRGYSVLGVESEKE